MWDWGSQSSNYTAVRDAGYQATQHRGWLVEAAADWVLPRVDDAVMATAEHDPYDSGYDPDKAAQQAQDDLAALRGDMSEYGAWVTRLRGELSRSALGSDLVLQAAPQSSVSGSLYVTNTIGDAPACPCGADGLSSSKPSKAGCACSVARAAGHDAGLWAWAFLGSMLAARRVGRRHSARSMSAAARARWPSGGGSPAK